MNRFVLFIAFEPKVWDNASTEQRQRGWTAMPGSTTSSPSTGGASRRRHWPTLAMPGPSVTSVVNDS